MNIPRGRIHFPDAIAIDCKDVPRRVYKCSDRKTELRTGGWPAVPAKPVRSVSSDGPNISGSGNHFPNATILGVRNENVSGAINRNAAAVSEGEFRAGGRSPVRAKTTGSVPGNGLNSSRGSRHFSDAIAIGYKDVPCVIDQHTRWVNKTPAGGWAAVPAEAGHSVPGHGPYNSSRRQHFPDTIVGGISNEDVP